jgi:hypothetical protein
MLLHPITFSVPKDKICEKQEYKKTKIVSSLIPGDTKTYIYDTEEDYYNEYKMSFFAITMKKSGWDCMRHYEILMNGCLPYFINIEDCPRNTMYLLPKHLLVQSNSLYDAKFKSKNIDELTEDALSEYNSLREQLLDYTRNFLTTEKMVEYMLKTTNHENATKILYLSGDTGPDYLRCITLHGFKSLFGRNCHDYPKIPHIYKTGSINYKTLYGKGMTYTNLLDESSHDNHLDSTLLQDIQNKYYDIVIYGSYHRGMPYYDLISSVYQPQDIMLMCGEDIHCCNYNEFLRKGHHVFVREL